MKNLLQTLQTLGAVSGICAILCLFMHCVYEFRALWDRRYDDVARMEKWAWAGLVWAALWMACEVGTIGF